MNVAVRHYLIQFLDNFEAIKIAVFGILACSVFLIYNKIVNFLQWIPCGISLNKKRFQNVRCATNAIGLIKSLNLVPDTLVDVGANVSQWSHWLAKQWPNMTIFSFEPNRNLETIGIRRMEALSNKSGFGELSDKSSSANLLMNDAGSIEVVRFDCLNIALGQTNILKIDAENCTADALIGFGEQIKKFSVVICEMLGDDWQNAKGQQSRIWNFLIANGFLYSTPLDAGFDRGKVLSYDLAFWKPIERSNMDYSRESRERFYKNKTADGSLVYARAL